MQETQVRFQGWEDPLEKGMAIHSNILACRIPWTEEPRRLCPWGHKESDTTKWLHFTFSQVEDMSTCVCVCVCVCVYVFSHQVLSNSFVTPWTVAHQASLSMGFPRQEYWSGLPFPSPGKLSNPGTEHASPASPELAAGFFSTEPPGKPHIDLTTWWFHS